jgi:ribonuclease HII
MGVEWMLNVAGIDEAGRGPILGPMVVCGVLLDRSSLPEFKAAGVRDSKMLNPGRREKLAEFILQNAIKCEVIELKAQEIDRLRIEEKINLNEIEAMVFAKIVNRLRPSVVYIDSPDVMVERFKNKIQGRLRVKSRLIVENYADEKYIPVSAASIVAKVRRDRRIRELQSRYGDIGSGYCSDLRTIKFLERCLARDGALPSFARRSWSCRRLENILGKS